MGDEKAKGREHEDRAADYLLSLGYTIVTRRFKSGSGEVDLIALDGDTLVFVEVKFRGRGIPEEAVGHTKVKRFSDAVSGYMAKTGTHLSQTRFDLVAMTPTEIRHHKGAFNSL